MAFRAYTDPDGGEWVLRDFERRRDAMKYCGFPNPQDWDRSLEGIDDLSEDDYLDMDVECLLDDEPVTIYCRVDNCHITWVDEVVLTESTPYSEVK